MAQDTTKTELVYVYIMELANNQYYCGITNDLERRAKEHNSPGDGYCQKRRPAVLRWSQVCTSRKQARTREVAIKSQTPKRYYLKMVHTGNTPATGR